MRWSQEVYLTSPKLISRLRCVFNKYGGGFAEFDDFYHDYVIHLLESKGLHQTLDQYAIDWYRTFVGRKGGKKFFAKAIGFDECSIKNETRNGYEEIGYITHVKELLQKYSGRARVLVMLHYVYGFEVEEIAILFNRTPSNIAQLLARIREGESLREQDAEKENLELIKENLELRQKLKKKYS